MYAVVIRTLSVDRFDTYLKAAGHDIDRAIRLYVWNAQIGSSFHIPIQAVEVALRNTINNALVAKFGADWWRNQAFTKLFDRERRTDMDMVIRRIQRKGLPLITAQIVAGLSFGFWVGLLQPKYNPDVWSSQLRVAFPHLPATETRVTLFKYAGDVATLRNRISHHEPIFKRDLLTDFGELMKLLAWICPDTSSWIRPHCQVPALMRSKP
jgi:hypothetical protein